MSVQVLSISREPELRQCEISAARGLSALLATEADAHVGGHNHGHIVGLNRNRSVNVNRLVHRLNKSKEFNFILNTWVLNQKLHNEFWPRCAVTDGQRHRCVIHELDLSSVKRSKHVPQRALLPLSSFWVSFRTAPTIDILQQDSCIASYLCPVLQRHQVNNIRFLLW